MSSRHNFLRSRGEVNETENRNMPSAQNYYHQTSHVKTASQEPFFNDFEKEGNLLDKSLTQKKNPYHTNYLNIPPKNKNLRMINTDLNQTGKQEQVLETPTSDVRLLKRQDSAKTEKKNYNSNLNNQHSLKGELHKYAPPQKLNTFKSTTSLQANQDLRRPNVETNIDPRIIQYQEEMKEQDRIHGDDHDGLLLTHKRGDSQSRSQRTGDGNPSHKEEVKSDEPPKSLLSAKIIGILTKEKKDIFANIVEEDNEILDLKKNIDLETMAQGKIDPFSNFNPDLNNEVQHKPERCIIYRSDCNFVMDIIFNFRTTFINEKTGLEVRDGKSIAKEYLKQWRFYFDLLSIIPFEFLYNIFNPDGDGSTTQFKIFDLLKLIRLLRLGRIITYLKFKQDIKIGFRIIQLLCMLLLIVHWVACLWFLIIEDSPWIPPMDANYGETEFYKVGMWKQYSVVFYYAILLLLGGDILPVNTVSTIYASVIVITGSLVTAFIFGNMAVLIAAMNQKDSEFQDQFDSIQNLMRTIKLPAEVQSEVEAYLLHIQQVPDMQQSMRIFLKILSPSLRSTILFHLYKTIIGKIPIFDSCSNIELRFIVNFMKTVIFLPDDEIIRQGDKGSKIYFISRGSVQVFIGPDDEIETYDTILRENQAKNFEKMFMADFKKNKHLDTTSNHSVIHNEGGEAENENDESQLVSVNNNSHKRSISNHSKNKASVSISQQDVKDIDEKSQGPQVQSNKKFIREQVEGDYFGEISIITNLKRTATVKAKDFTTLGYLIARNFQAAKDEFPQIYQSFKKQIRERYQDENFIFRQRMIQNVPYFRNLSDNIIQELIYILRPNRYDPNMLIVKRGDSTDRIYFLKAGIVDVEVPLKSNERMHFDTLNAGSCFCVFSAFHEDKKQKFDFRARTICIVESISAKDIIRLQKEHLELSDELKTLMIQIENNKKSEFDFFRFVPKRNVDSQTEERKQIVRKKFRMAIARFLRRMKRSKALLNVMNLNKQVDTEINKKNLYNHILNQNDESDDNSTNDDRKQFKALYALDKLEKERKEKEQKLKYYLGFILDQVQFQYLKDKCQSPSLLALTDLVNKSRQENRDNISGNVELDSVDHLEPGEERKENQQINTLHRNFEFNHTQSYHENQLNESLEINLQNYPRIDSIRNELFKIRKQSNPHQSKDINQNSLENQYQNGYLDTISRVEPIQVNKNYRQAQTQPIINISTLDNIPEEKGNILPAFNDKQKVNINQGDESIQRMNTENNQENVQTQERQQNDSSININEIFLEDRRANLLGEDFPYQPQWRKKMLQLNLQQINEESKYDKEDRILSPSTSRSRKKNLHFDNITLRNIDKQQQILSERSQINIKKEGTSNVIEKSQNDATSNNGEDLINVLNQINQSLINQQESMNALKNDMAKRMSKLERKLVKAIKVDQSIKTPQRENSSNNKPIIVMRKSHQLVVSDDQTQKEENLKQNSDEKKRLISQPHLLGSIYNNSEFQFIQQKNSQKSFHSVVSKVQSQKVNQIEALEIPKQAMDNRNMPKSLRNEALNNEELITEIIENIGGESGGTGVFGKMPRTQRTEFQRQMDTHANEEYKHRSSISNIQRSRDQYVNNTPYFTSEYQETLIENNYPMKVTKRQNLDMISEKASTEQKFLAEKGPEVTNAMQKVIKKENEQVFKRLPYSPEFGYLNKLREEQKNMQTLMNKDDSQEIIDILDMEQIDKHENTIIFEEQLDKSIERIDNKQDDGMKFQLEVALQIYACWPPNGQPNLIREPTFSANPDNLMLAKLPSNVTVTSAVPSTPKKSMYVSQNPKKLMIQNIQGSATKK